MSEAIINHAYKLLRNITEARLTCKQNTNYSLKPTHHLSLPAFSFFLSLAFLLTPQPFFPLFSTRLSFLLSCFALANP